MDFDQNEDIPDLRSPQQSPPPGYIPPVSYYPPPMPPRKSSAWKIFVRIILVMSILANILMFVMLLGLGAFLVTGHGMLSEHLIRESDAKDKIAVISVEGIIHSQLADSVYDQLEAAASDRNVKGLIVRVNSPGGTISGSDGIYHMIQQYRKEHSKPVVAFMQGVAASGGYYASVACEKIIAEPTTITGSIGVISWWLVVQELLEDKLGIMPVTVKSGRKKDWPTSFRKPDAEELEYIENKLIRPAYGRFLTVIAEGRKGILTVGEIAPLADGAIFAAEEARKEKLIDDIGYLDDAIAMVKSMAGIQDARVIEYRRPFSFGDLLIQKNNTLKIDRNTLYEIGTPQILYLWSAY
ncbi:MAG: signal peptide peptidase SppA [Sedimentisphaerales bacterium]|nr:signal peptide peptidase SppA [Sedimentisphaerales bacterium]